MGTSDGTEGVYDVSKLFGKETALTVPLGAAQMFQWLFLKLGALCWRYGLKFNTASLNMELLEAGKRR